MGRGIDFGTRSKLILNLEKIYDINLIKFNIIRKKSFFQCKRTENDESYSFQVHSFDEIIAFIRKRRHTDNKSPLLQRILDKNLKSLSLLLS